MNYFDWVTSVARKKKKITEKEKIQKIKTKKQEINENEEIRNQATSLTPKRTIKTIHKTDADQ